MKAYNSDYVRNRAVQQQALRWQREGLLEERQLVAIRQAYPAPFRSGNVFAEIGAFLFTGVAVGGGYSLLLLFSSSILDSTIGFFLLNTLVGLGLMALTHNIIRKSHLYRNGPDNALILLAASFLLTAVNVLLPNETALWLRCLLAVPLLLAFVAYYGDVIVTFIALLCFYTALFDGLLRLEDGRIVLPFVAMGVSLAVRWLLIRARRWVTHETYYDDAFAMAEWITVVALMAAGNYFVVRELNGQVTITQAGTGSAAVSPQLSLAALFWSLTFLVPGLHLYLGVKRKNRMFLILGALGLMAAVATVRYYYPLLPLSLYLTVTGLLTVIGSVATIRFLRTPRFGFTDVPDEDSPRQFFLNAETLSVLSATGTTLGRTPGMKYGDGDFGGGGAGRGY